MQNSIWKLTALVGVVGVGLLIVMQAQQGLTPDPNLVAENGADNSSGGPDSGTNDPGWKPNEQGEPGVGDRVVLGPMNSDKLDPQAERDAANAKSGAPRSFFDDSENTKVAGLFDSGNRKPDFENEPTSRSQFGGSAARSRNAADELFALDGPRNQDAVFDKFDDATPASAQQPPATAAVQRARAFPEYTEFANGADSPTANSTTPKLLTIDEGDSDAGPFFDPQSVGQATNARQPRSLTPLFDEAGTVRENESGIVPVAGVQSDETDLLQPAKKLDPFATDEDKASLPKSGVPIDPGSLIELDTKPATGSNPGLLGGPLDENPFGSKQDTGPLQLLPDNPPKLLDDPTPLLDEPLKNSPEIVQPKLDSPTLDDTPFGTKSNPIDDNPLGQSTPSLASPKPANPTLDDPLQPLRSGSGLNPIPADTTKSDATNRISPDPELEKKEVRGDGVIPKNGPSAEQRPELTIEKVAPPQATLGKPMIYSIVITNRGATNAAKVTVEDVIPLGCKLVGTIPQAELIESKLIWKLGRLPSGELKKIHVKVVPISEGEVGSVATVSFVSEVAARTDVRQPVLASIRVTATAPNQVRIGEPVKLFFKILNTGTIDADKMTLQDLIPEGFEHEAGADLTYEIGSIKAGDSVDVDLELKAIKAGTYVNRAIIKQDGNARAESKATIEVIDGSRLTLQSVPTPAGLVSQKMTHSFKVSNLSNVAVTNARAVARLPREVRFVDAANGGTYDPNSHAIEWRLDSLASQQSITLSSTLTPTSTGNYSATLQVTQPNSPMTQIESGIEAKGIAALAINLSNVPVTAKPGDEFTVDATITNRGTGPDSNVRFSISLPSNIEYVSARGPVKSGIVQTSDGQKTVPFAVIPEIGEQAVASFQITLRARSAGRPKLRAEVSSQQLDEPVATEAAVVILDAQ